MAKFAGSIIVPMKHTYIIDDDSVTTPEQARTLVIARAQRDLGTTVTATVNGEPYTLIPVSQQNWDTGITQIS